MERLAVVLIVSSPLLRARLRASLAQVPDMLLVGETEDAGQGAHLALAHGADLVLCDLPMLTEPALAGVMTQMPRLQAVVARANEEPVRAPANVRVAGIVPFTLRPSNLASRLRTLLEEALSKAPPARPAAPAELPPDLRQRYRITGPGVGMPATPPPSPPPVVPPAHRVTPPVEQPVQQSAPASPAPPPPVNGHMTAVQTPVSPVKGPTPPNAAVPAVARSKRRLSVRQARLTALLQDVQQDTQRHQRDPITGLVGASALEQTLSMLTGVQHDAAIVMVEVQDAHGSLPAARLLDTTLLRAVSNAVRTSIRMDDFMCRAGPATFVVLLPGLVPDTAKVPLDRVRAALAPLSRSMREGEGCAVAISMGFWQADRLPAEVLAQCRGALNRGSGGQSTGPDLLPPVQHWTLS